MKAGETFRCSNPDCGCEVTVVKEPRQPIRSAPRCSCGRDMELVTSNPDSALQGEMRAS
jgi:hypothetical protein